MTGQMTETMKPYLGPPVAIFSIAVDGVPKSKGSLRPVGRRGRKVRLIEQVGGSTDWRARVAGRSRAARSLFPDPVRRWQAGKTAASRREERGWPFRGPVRLAVMFLVPRPASVTSVYPITRSAGDLDKLERNIGDALKDAGVLGDDSQIVQIFSQKCFSDESGAALITVYALPEIAEGDGRGAEVRV